MDIELTNLSHRFKEISLFQGIDYQFKEGSKTVILGENGSGKSTLLQIISSYLSPTEGRVKYLKESIEMDSLDIWKNFSVCSPFLEIEENFNLDETFDFHFALKTPVKTISKEDFFDICFLQQSRIKLVKQLSSGMRQRLKLALCFLTNSNCLLLDEPCMNLDAKGIELYQTLVYRFSGRRTQIISSNSVKAEYTHCDTVLNLSDYK